MPYALNINLVGLKEAVAVNDGYSINLKWFKEYPLTKTNKVGYHIYMEPNLPDSPKIPVNIFGHSPKFISISSTLNVDIIDLIPGETYWFAVRGFEYDNSFDFDTLPTVFNNLKVYPESLLRDNINSTDLIIPLIDVSNFPDTGTIKLGAELINYTSKDLINNNLILSSLLQRGYSGTATTQHNTDGYDGYAYWDANALFWPVILEEQNTVVYSCQCRFDIDHYAANVIDGYKQKTKDFLNTDLNTSDELLQDFTSYDYAGWRRTDPVALLRGDCVGSYFGGEVGCVDGYSGVGMRLRGIGVEEQNLQRIEIQLDLTGEPVVLMKRIWTGIVCSCYTAHTEYPNNRCRKCFGTGQIAGYNQYFNFPRRSDSKIMVRFDPAQEDIKSTDAGYENDITYPCFTLPFPTIRDRDFLVRFDQAGNEDARYEIINVTRGKFLLENTSVQRFNVQRVRKTDPIYQVKVFKDTAMFPQTINTTIASAPPYIAPHSHKIVINEGLISGMQQMSSTDHGHNHVVHYNVSTGQLELGSTEDLGHTHYVVF
jgi:hypothetical protein